MKKYFSEHGDTLIEVTIALSILSLTLMGATRLAIRAFQQGQTARERTTISSVAQQQLEHLRSFRDTHSWAEFLNGNVSGTFNGVLSTHNAPVRPCKTSGCFMMQQQFIGGKQTFVPVDGSTTSSAVPNSYVEITATPDNAATPTLVKFTVSWGFPDIGGGPANTSHVITELSRLTATAPASVPIGPSASAIDSPCVDGVAELVYNFVNMSLFETNYNTIDAYIDANGLGWRIGNQYYNSIRSMGNGQPWPLANPPQLTFNNIGILTGGKYSVTFKSYDDHTDFSDPLRTPDITHMRFSQDARNATGSAQDTVDRDGLTPPDPVLFQRNEAFRLDIYIAGMALPISTTYTPDIAPHENIEVQTYTIPVTLPANANVTKIVVVAAPRSGNANPALNSAIDFFDFPNVPYDGNTVLPVCAGFTWLGP